MKRICADHGALNCSTCFIIEDNYREIESLKEQLAKAIEVIEFYANRDSWDYVNQYNKTMMKADFDMNINFSDKFGGKKAREFLKGLK